MTRKLSGIIVLFLILSLTGCQKNETLVDFVSTTEEDTASKSTAENIKEVDVVETDKEMDGQNEGNHEEASPSIETETDKQDIAGEKIIEQPRKPIDFSDFEDLTDSELVKLYYDHYSHVDNYMMVTNESFNDMKSVVTSYYFNRNVRLETKTNEATVVMIFNAKDRANYQYVVGETTGLATYLEEDYELIGEIDGGFAPDNIDENTKAELVGLDGEMVILITTEHPQIAYKSMTWLSIDKGIPVKSEIYQDDILVRVNEVVLYERLSEEDMYLFDKPEGIEFSE